MRSRHAQNLHSAIETFLACSRISKSVFPMVIECFTRRNLTGGTPAIAGRIYCCRCLRVSGGGCRCGLSPTVGVLRAGPTGGPALPLLPKNVLLSARKIPPPGVVFE